MTAPVLEKSARVQIDDPLNVYIEQDTAKTDAQIAASKARLDSGQPASEIDGWTVAVKDNYCTEDYRTTAASKILEDFQPTYESTVTSKLRAAGGVVNGKVNMDEFAMGSSTETSHFGPTLNPVAKALGLSDRVPGGSSGGSAAAVAAGLADVALGSDTGGSIRQPAAFCGVVGYKPTYGLCSRWGIIAYASSLDQAGAFGKSVSDVAKVMKVISGHDAQDSTSWAGAYPSFELSTERKPIKIGVAKEVMDAAQNEHTNAIWTQIEALKDSIGAEIVPISLPTMKYALPSYYVLALSEASSNLARYDGVRYGFRADNPSGDLNSMYQLTRSQGFGQEIKRRIMSGTFSLSTGYYDAYYLQAARVRRMICEEFAAAYRDVDVIAMPTTPTPAFEVGVERVDPTEMYLEDVFTVPVNLAGLPAISVPAAKAADGMPLGMQLIGPRFGDDMVLNTAAAVEASLA